jgi:hypothetical protein
MATVTTASTGDLSEYLADLHKALDAVRVAPAGRVITVLPLLLQPEKPVDTKHSRARARARAMQKLRRDESKKPSAADARTEFKSLGVGDAGNLSCSLCKVKFTGSWSLNTVLRELILICRAGCQAGAFHQQSSQSTGAVLYACA